MKFIGVFLAAAWLLFQSTGDGAAVEVDVCQKRYDSQTGNMVQASDNPEIRRMCEIVALQARMIKIMKLQQPDMPFAARIPREILSLYDCEQGSSGSGCSDSSAGSVCRSLGFDAYVSHSYSEGQRHIDVKNSDGTMEKKLVAYISDVVCQFYPDATKYDLIEAQIQN